MLVFDDTTDGPHVPDLPDTVATALRGEKSLAQVESNNDSLRVATFPILHEGQIAGVGILIRDLLDQGRIVPWLQVSADFAGAEFSAR